MKYGLTLLLIISTTLFSFGQQQVNSDTLEQARALAYAKNFAEADRLLTRLTRSRTDVNALRLHAQVLYWMKAFSRSEQVYQRAIRQFPEVPHIRLDYGRMLFELNKPQQAELQLRQYLANDPQHAEAHMLLTYIEWGRGDDHAARRRSTQLRQWYPDNKDISQLADQVRQSTGTTVRAGGTFQSDDQPLRRTTYDVEVQSKYSRLIAPRLRLQANDLDLYTTGYVSQWGEVGNRLALGTSGTSAEVWAGVFQYRAVEGLLGISKASYRNVTGGLRLLQKLTGAWQLELGAERKPYQYTLASIRTPLMMNHLSAGLNLNKSDKWLGKVAYEQQQFGKADRLETAYAWLMAPLVRARQLDIRVGYSFTYANSDKSTFTPVLPLSAIIATSAQGKPIEGVYNPYFSPLNQFINAGLLSVKVTPAPFLDLTAKANVGVYALAEVPYYELGNAPGNKVVLTQGRVQQPYTPYSLTGEMKIRCNKDLTLSSTIEYSSLLFYTNKLASAHLTYHF
jgi:tetratricopeptide (TPR) repeat protein